MTRLTKTQTMELLLDDLAIFEVDKDTGKINGATKAMERMFGFEESAALNGKLIGSIIPSLACSDFRVNELLAVGNRVDETKINIRVVLTRPRVADDGVVVVSGIIFAV